MYGRYATKNKLIIPLDCFMVLVGCTKNTQSMIANVKGKDFSAVAHRITQLVSLQSLYHIKDFAHISLVACDIGP